MTRNDLIRTIAKKHGLRMDVARRIVESIIDESIDGLVRDGQLRLEGFITLNVNHREARILYSGLSDKQTVTPSRKRVKFTASRRMIRALNEQKEPEQ